MCLFPRKILNRSKTHYLNGGQSAYVTIPCGQCSECRAAKVNEYSFRAYYEMMSTLDKGGYIYFDTLTYSDEHLPHVSDFISEVPKGSFCDFPCFERKSPHRFFCKLKTQLERRGFNPKAIRYFFTSEYGTDPNRTHRPHYHVLFYITDPSLDWLTFSSAVQHAWTYGRTDGIGYQSAAYVSKHVYTTDTSEPVQQVVNYVSKYVVKDCAFQDVLSERELQLMYYLDDGQMSIEDLNKYRKKVLRSISPFHTSSNHFGADFLKYNDIKSIESSNTIRMPDKNTTWRVIPIPQYFKRLLWYKTEPSPADPSTMRWVLNDAGLGHYRRYVYNIIDSTERNFKDFFANLHVYVGRSQSLHYQSLIGSLLHGRSMRDYATYLVAYRWRTLSLDNILRLQRGEQLVLPSLEEQLYSNCCCGGIFFYSYLLNYDLDHFGKKFLSSDYLGTYKSDYERVDYDTGEIGHFQLRDASVVISPDTYLIRSNTFDAFAGFDEVYELVLKLKYRFNCTSDDSAKHKEYLRRRMFNLYTNLL